MSVEIITGDGYITAILSGELDHHSVAPIRELIDARLSQMTPDLLILDFQGVSFMDSSAIGLILGRQRTAAGYGGRVVIKNPSRHAEKIIKMSGLSGLIIPEKKIQKNLGETKERL